MPETLHQQVNDHIAQIGEAWSEAMDDLGSWLVTDTDEEAMRGLRAKKVEIDRWAERGIEAARTGAAPGVNGWRGWTEAGTWHLRYISTARGIGESGTLDAITATVEQAPAVTAKAVGRAVRGAAKTAGAAVADVVTPTAQAAGGLLIPIAIIAVAVVALKLKK